MNSLRANSGYNALPDRFHAKVLLDEDTGCLEWIATRSRDGYGGIKIDGKMYLAHRVAYQAEHDGIPDGLVIDHLCRNTSCVNPSHLEAVTHQENCRRGNQGQWARSKTHCPQGHAYDDSNTRVNDRGFRVCRACSLEASRKSRRKRCE